ncbi:abietadienol/abietadienal oxidase isoform X2 [Rhododendron vialii]|uniref:abietadienol/abietadienal oxidase isoform X2 n=1 Tax=Rhododendron vialii TaxID=182163 RepID=UPI00265D8FD5|nr:abietadienol/abietadienal oxidase isoform X2 [Rhododendron vialii]
MRETCYGTVWAYAMIVAVVFVIVFLSKFELINRKSTYYKKRTENGNEYKLPPGGRGWPLIGDSLSWYNAVASSHPPSYVQQEVQRYGKIFSCSVFGKRAVVSADPSFNRFIMQNEGKLFQSSYPKSFRDLVGKNGVITVQGDQQRKLHGIASNMMRLDKLKSHFLKDIQMVMLQTLNNFRDNQVILLQDVCRKATINLMVNQLLGASSEREEDEMARLFSDFVDGCLSLPINFPGFAYHTAMKARETIITKIKTTIEKHRQEEDTKEGGNGLLGRLVDEESLPDYAVVDFLINLIFAGNETTAKTMLFAVYYLTQSPPAMKQLLDEQRRLRSGKSDNKGEDMFITWQDYKQMSFTQCVIDETLRLGGIAIWLMREAKEDIQYQGYVVPKGCFVVPFLSAVHLDENLYEGARTFNPWRWMDPLNKELEKQPFLRSLWWRSSILSRGRIGSPSNCSLSSLLCYFIQVDPAQGRSYVFLSLCPISEWLRNPNHQTRRRARNEMKRRINCIM